MSDPLYPPPEPGDGDDSFRWESGEDLPVDASAEDGPRQRHDAFAEARKADFLTALVKTGCLLDACRKIGVSARTVYRHQESDPRFRANCETALRMSATPIELTAWERAVEGVEQEFACGGQVHVRRRYDGSLLRLLLQGSNPKKYGARPGFKRKRLYKHEKKRMEKEIRAEIADERMSFEDSILLLDKNLQALGLRQDQRLAAAGWTQLPDGEWIPPGYGPIPGWVAPGAEAEGEEPPGDSM